MDEYFIGRLVMISNLEECWKYIPSLAVIFFLGAFIGGIGIWHIYFTARVTQIPYLITGAALMMAGFFVCVHADLIVDYFSENAIGPHASFCPRVARYRL